MLLGQRKEIQSENGKYENLKKLEQLKKRKIELVNKKQALQQKFDSLKRLIEERKSVEEQKRKDEIKFLTDQQSTLNLISNSYEGGSG